MDGGGLQASLTFLVEGKSKVGAERIALLEAVGRLGSLSAAARQVGISYRAAWDAVRAMNNMLPQPVAVLQAGGSHGGETVLTAQGRRIIAAFHQLQAELSRFAAQLRQDAAGPEDQARGLLNGLFLRTSARNMLKATVRSLAARGANVGVLLELSERLWLEAVVTRRSVDDLGLCLGGGVVALIKSNAIEVEPEPPCGAPLGGNRIAGIVCRMEPDRESHDADAEVSVDLGQGKTLTAVVSRPDGQGARFAPGMPVVCRIDPSHIVLAVE